MTLSTIAGILASLAGGFGKPGKPDLKPPVVEFRVNSRVIVGEPIFLQCTITNPNGAYLTVWFPPSPAERLSYRIERDGPIALLASAKQASSLALANAKDRRLDATSRSGWYTIEPHGHYAEVDFVGIENVPSQALDIHAAAPIAYIAGYPTSVTAPQGVISLRAEDRLRLTVEQGSTDALADAALRIGEVIVRGDEPMATGFYPILRGGARGFDAWLSMPAAVCAQSWRAVLLSGDSDLYLDGACAILARKPEPEAKALVADIVRYADEKDPKLARAVRYAIAHCRDIARANKAID